MKMINAIAIAAVLIGAPVTVAPTAAQDLPAAAELVAKYQAAIGGVEALAARTSVRSVGQVAIPAAGMTASFEAWQARPNRTAMHAVLPGFGDLRSGYTGDIAWSVNPMEGPRVMQGGEADQTADEASFDWQVRSGDRFESMTTVALTTMAGQECYRVRVLWKSGRESFDCYSTDTGLIVGSTARQESNMGAVDATTLYADYKDFSGVMMPSRVTIQTMGMEQIITIREVTFDQVPDSVFEAPAEIRALIRP